MFFPKTFFVWTKDLTELTENPAEGDVASLYMLFYPRLRDAEKINKRDFMTLSPPSPSNKMLHTLITCQCEYDQQILVKKLLESGNWKSGLYKILHPLPPQKSRGEKSEAFQKRRKGGKKGEKEEK